MTAGRCFGAAFVCALIVASLTGWWSDRIFGDQAVRAENEVIGIQILEPGFQLELTP